MEDKCLKKLCYEIPKAELHIHIEGTLEPELMLEIAKRNNIPLSYTSTEELKSKYNFKNLQDFLDIYYLACSVLIYKQDFSDLMYEYLKRSQGVVYAEVFFDPQTHVDRGISLEVVLEGLNDGIKRGKQMFNINVKLIMCFLRHLSQESCLEVYDQARKYKDDIMGVGLDSSELGNRPSKFKELYAKAKDDGFFLVAHAGEEGDASYIQEALDLLKVSRVDHGYRITESEELMKRAADEQIPLTLCPLSNKMLKVCPDLSNYPIKQLLNTNILCTLNSDDPAYFGGYLGDNYYELAKAINLTKEDIIHLAKNSFRASNLSSKEKDAYIEMIDSMYTL
jgi:adenosine deaminase